MAKDGTNRGGRRVRAGAKPDPLNEKLAAGRPATRLAAPSEFDVFDLDDLVYRETWQWLDDLTQFCWAPSINKETILSGPRDRASGVDVRLAPEVELS